MKAEPQTQMERASDELERRSRYLSSLIRQQRTKHDSLVLEEEQQEQPETLNGAPPKTVGEGDERKVKEEVVPANVRIRASDMAPELQKRAFRCAREVLEEMPKLDSKRFALTLKKEFDSTYGPAWHCIVGTSFGSYVTHSVGGFLYFSIDKVYILLFRTAVEPLAQ